MTHDELMDRFDAGEVLAASRVMSVVERGGTDAEAVLDRLFPRLGGAYRVGITGGTGGGKSTLVNALVRRYRAGGSTVGVVAEDPTSPLTGGAILGDRVRMGHAAGDAGVFVRSVASRGSETGFSVLAEELADILDAFGRDVILLETTGVGQLEFRIRHSADTTVVVFTPEGGDDVQSLKSGLVEIGDVFVVNKSDRPQADAFADHLTAILQIRYEDAEWAPRVVQTAATRDEGLDALFEALKEHRKHMATAGRLEKRRRRGLEARLRSIATERLGTVFWGNPYIRSLFDGIFEDVASGRLSPYAAARRLVTGVEIRPSD
jgi:LAO/AO transport system kinase